MDEGLLCLLCRLAEIHARSFSQTSQDPFPSFLLTSYVLYPQPFMLARFRPLLHTLPRHIPRTYIHSRFKMSQPDAQEVKPVPQTLNEVEVKEPTKSSGESG